MWRSGVSPAGALVRFPLRKKASRLLAPPDLPVFCVELQGPLWPRASGAGWRGPCAQPTAPAGQARGPPPSPLRHPEPLPTRDGTGREGQRPSGQLSRDTRFSALLANAVPRPVPPVGPACVGARFAVRIRSSQGFSAEGVLPPPSPGSRAAPAAEEAGGGPGFLWGPWTRTEGRCARPHMPRASAGLSGSLWGTRGAQSAGDVPLGSSLLGAKGSSCRGETGWPHCVPEGHWGWGLGGNRVPPEALAQTTPSPWHSPRAPHAHCCAPVTRVPAAQASVPNAVAPGCSLAVPASVPRGRIPLACSLSPRRGSPPVQQLPAPCSKRRGLK